MYLLNIAKFNPVKMTEFLLNVYIKIRIMVCLVNFWIAVGLHKPNSTKDWPKYIKKI